MYHVDAVQALMLQEYLDGYESGWRAAVNRYRDVILVGEVELPGHWDIADDAAQDATAEEVYRQLERGEIEPGGEIPY